MPDHFHFKPVTAEDLPLLHDWLNRPHVADIWEGPLTFEQVQDEFLPMIGSPMVTPYLAYWQGRPVGYIQSYVVAGAGEGWWPDETDPGARGTDQFLAEASMLGKGLGTQMLREFIAMLFADPAVTKIQTDPAPDNARAIASYRKAGFNDVSLVQTPDGPALLMMIHRPDWHPLH